MSIQIIEENQGVTIVASSILMPGEPHFQEFEKLPHAIKNFSSTTVQLDLQYCKYMDTRAITIILEIYRELKKSGGTLSLMNANEEILDLLRTIRLDQLIKLN
jgi:anti-anti-sigma factor